MNAKLERTRTFLTIAVLFAALGFLYMQAAERHDIQHERVLEEFSEMLRADAELVRDALRVRAGLLRHYDSLNDAPRRLALGLARLRAEGERGAYGDLAPEIDAGLTRLGQSLADAEERIEQIKSGSALLNNSLAYLPMLRRELAARAGPGPWSELIRDLTKELLRYAHRPDKDSAEEIDALLERLAAGIPPGPLRAGGETLAAHARLVLGNSAHMDETLRELIAVSPGEEVRALEKSYLTHYTESQSRGGLFHALLFGASLLLLAYLGYLMFRLDESARGLRASVAERERAQRALHELNQSLERRVAERTVQLQALAREREAFAYSIAHDLRSPLGVISGFCHILGTDEQARLSDDGRRMLQVIEGNVAHLVSLVDALLALAQISRVKLERKTIDLGQVAAAAAEAHKQRYPRALIVQDPLPATSGDPTLIAQALSNLIENALKYSSRAAQPQVHVGWQPDAGACYVRDNGVGFDMRHAGRLFNAFERLHADSDFPGSGIGLAIVKRIVERHGGRVWAEAAPDRGATFYFSLAPPAAA